MRNGTLGGVTFIYRGVDQDYCFEETIRNLQELCDEVVVCVVNSYDGTIQKVYDLQDHKTSVIVCSTHEWNINIGREKLAHFQNIAINRLSTDYCILIQCDEILHESCFPVVREAIETGNEAFYVTRIHLWGTPYKQLDVPIERMPCGVNIIRLAKTKYRSVDDGESLLAPAVPDFVNEIRIYHVGFVRDKYKHLEKIRHIQDDIFLIEHDKRIDSMTDGFDPYVMFSETDLIPIKEPLPAIIQDWAKQRS